MEIIKALESLGHIEYADGTYVQKSENCLDIANLAAGMLGFKGISRQDVKDHLDIAAMTRAGWMEEMYRSAAGSYFIVRTPDNPRDAHVTFYHNWREYNFGASEKDGFVMDAKIPACALKN